MDVHQFLDLHGPSSSLYSTDSYCILLGKSAYCVRLHCREFALKDGCFIRRYPSDSTMYSTVPAPQIYSFILCSIYKSFKLVFNLDFICYNYCCVFFFLYYDLLFKDLIVHYIMLILLLIILIG